MIFSLNSVCLQYIFGIVPSVLFIRRYNLIGAGYYWLMYSVSSVLALFIVLSADTDTIVLSYVVLASQVGVLIYHIAQRAHVRESMRLIEYLLIAIGTFSTLFAMIILVANTVSSSFYVVESLRLLVGGLVLGGVTTAMLLGHWYLVQPGMSRAPIEKLSVICIGVVVLDIALWLLSPSMVSVITGSISDGWGGTLGYMWLGSCVTTIALLIAGRLALNEKSYTAVMATTGLLYLAILVANGVELIPRVIFA